MSQACSARRTGRSATSPRTGGHVGAVACVRSSVLPLVLPRSKARRCKRPSPRRPTPWPTACAPPRPASGRWPGRCGCAIRTFPRPTTRIASSTASRLYQFQYYNYMLWAVAEQDGDRPAGPAPGQRRRLRGGPARVRRQPTGVSSWRACWRPVEGLDSGDEWIRPPGGRAAASSERADGRTVWTKRIDAQKRVYNKQPVYAVRAISELLEQELDAACQELRTVMARARWPPAEDAP
ncbi:MAG: hypothetical protein MZV63_37440 [Marinilabiliales bacterium]|nr:hypothetical protein [Marinilabiliales bacterium]